MQVSSLNSKITLGYLYIPIETLANMSFLIIAKLDTFLEFPKIENSRCVRGIFDKYKSFDDAKNACVRESECIGFEDMECDGAGSYRLCKTSKKEDCFYKKGLSNLSKTFEIL